MNPSYKNYQFTDSQNYASEARIGAYRAFKVKDHEEELIGFSRAEVVRSKRAAPKSDHKELIGDVSAEVSIFYAGRKFTFTKKYHESPENLHTYARDIIKTVTNDLEPSLTSSLESIGNYKSGKKDPFIGRKSLKPIILSHLEKDNITVKVSKYKKDVSLKDISYEKLPYLISKRDVISDQRQHELRAFGEAEVASKKINKERTAKRLKKEKKIKKQSKSREEVVKTPVSKPKYSKIQWDETGGYTFIKKNGTKANQVE